MLLRCSHFALGKRNRVPGCMLERDHDGPCDQMLCAVRKRTKTERQQLILMEEAMAEDKE